MPTEKGSGVEVALRHARQIRSMVIDLSYELPENPSREILDAWTDADNGLHRLIVALKDGEATCSN